MKTETKTQSRMTPGKWHANELGGIYDESGFKIATVNDPCRDSNYVEMDSNARAIAATPELIEALKQLTEAAHKSNLVGLALTKARAALAKAGVEMEGVNMDT